MTTTTPAAIVRVEPDGPCGPLRTERSEITPILTGDEEAEYEIDWIGDASGSFLWEMAPPKDSLPTRWDVFLPAFREVVRLWEDLDSQAKTEQAEGSDEYGGVAAFFASDHYKPLNPDDLDDVDVNTSNFGRKMANVRPGGGTLLMKAVEAADAHYDDEFGKRPLSRRPRRLHGCSSDGEAEDWEDLEPRLQAANEREIWGVFLFGHGDKLERTVRAYKAIAAKNPFVKVFVFDSVTNPAEVAEDMKIALLGHKLTA